jgi:hypothetical protein
VKFTDGCRVRIIENQAADEASSLIDSSVSAQPIFLSVAPQHHHEFNTSKLDTYQLWCINALRASSLRRLAASNSKGALPAATSTAIV